MTGPKILVLDIETAPALADVWSLWNVNVGLSQLRQVSTVICLAAKWTDRNSVMFHSDHHDGHKEMVEWAHYHINEADIVVHYNGTRFDMPHLYREFLLAGLDPPSPVQEVDLLKVVKSRFRFQSNKLDHVTRQLGLAGKVQHTGHDLWVRCMAGDPKAWALMKRYNQGDVRLTQDLYERLLPWIKSHPHVGLFTGEEHACSRCGGTNLQRRGFKAAGLSMFQQYQCQGCKSWSRGKTAVARVDERGTA